ncbi:MAG: hypothetical protein CO113_13295 [Elusimicrobia bacterium CG_4_9_14_3_um_filter_62_55]|nr:MAG: hypothetical protein COX66_17685 [Elusimicrobia bacterium CG_4_10_14_0_2_um_filter_63_34]PJB24543.1 MAG: hypothetical protein CO113_13295 [Elusimicrobia bacterium CG_4_9_14_3_um_filter_62_55]
MAFLMLFLPTRRDEDPKNHQLNFDYMTVTVYYRTVDSITVTPQNPAAGNKSQGAAYAAERLSLATDQFNAQWTAITVNETGTAADADITDVRVYKDANANGSYDAGTDTAISGANTFTGGTVAITLSAAETISTTSQDYFIVYTLAALATNGATVTAQIPAAGLTVTAPDLLAATNLPSTSPAQTIVDAADIVSVTGTNRAPGTVAQGTTNMETQYLSMATDNETATWTAITVKKLGTIPDTDITAVTLYDDTGATANQWDATDVAISAGATFTAGSAAITLTAPQTITTGAKVYHIIYTLSSTAQVAATVGSRVNAASDVTLSGVDIVAGTYPLDSTTPAVTDVADTVTAAHTDTPPGAVLQGQQYAPMKFTLATGADEATWTGITVTAQGTAGDADVDDVDIYLDTGNGIWGGEDTLISNAAAEPFLGGARTLTLASAQTITTSAKTYHIVLKINSAANTSATIGAGINAAGDISVSGVDTVDSAGYPKNSSATPIDPPGNNVTMSAPTNVAPGSANQGATDVAVLRFTMASSPGTASWTDLAVTKTGTLPDADIDTVKIYRADATTPDTFDGGDTLISPAVTTFSGGAAAITLSSPESVTTTPQKYFVVYSFDALATTGTTAGAELTSEAAMTITPPDLMLGSNFPANSTNLTINDVADSVTVVAADQAPDTAVQGDSYAALRLRMSTNQDQALWSAITVHKTGTLADGSVTATIYKDANANGTFESGTDTAVSAATAFSAGAAAITLSAPENQSTSTQDYFVVYTLAALAAVGDTVDAQVSQADLTLAGGVDTVNAFTGDSAATTVTDLGDTLTMTPTDNAIGSIAQGGALSPQRLSLATDAETASWTGITVTKTGTLNDADITAVTIYDDSGGTLNSFDGTDAAVSAGTVFSSSAAAITLTPAQTITTSPQVYHIVYSITTTAVVGNSAGSSLPTNAALVLAGTDLVSSSGFPAGSTNASITDTPDTVTETPTDTAPTQIPQGGTNDFLRLSMATDDDQAVWTAITVSKLGTLADAQVDSVMIYLDDGDNSFDSATDTLISPAVTTFTGGAAAITLSQAQTITGTPKVYFVVYDLNNSATVSNTISARIASEAALTVTAPDLKTTFTNHDSTLAAVVAAPTITLSRVDLSPTPDIGQGADYATQRLDAVTDLGSAQISAIRVTKTGTIKKTDVTAVKIFEDTDGSGDYGPNDSVLASGPFGGPGTVTLTLSPAPTVTTSGSSLFVVYTLKGAVGTGVTVGSSIAGEGDVTAVAPALVAATNFPLTSGTPTTAVPDYGVLITVGTIDIGLQPLDQDYIVTSAATVDSVGNMPQHYALEASTTVAGSPWVIALSSGVDQFTLQGLFNSALPTNADFSEADKIADPPTTCSTNMFEGDRVCRSVGPGVSRSLWLRVGMPTQSSTDLQQDIQVTVTAIPP